MISTFCRMPFEYALIDCSAASAMPNSSRSAVDLPLHRRRRQLAKPAEQPQLLARREERVERRLLRHVAEPSPVLDRLVGDVPAVEEDGSARRLDEAGQHPAGGRLARAIRAEIADHLSRLHDEAHVVHDRDAVEALDQVTCFEKMGHGGSRSARSGRRPHPACEVQRC